MKIKCRAVKKLFPFEVEDELSFVLVLYETDGMVEGPSGPYSGEFKAKGP